MPGWVTVLSMLLDRLSIAVVPTITLAIVPEVDMLAIPAVFLL